MSGIFGLFEKGGGKVARPALETMRRAMDVWGPDAHGLWCGECAGLGHVLMRTTPQSRDERRPTTASWAPGQVLVADARLDHREDLAGALGLASSEAEAETDDLLILRAWSRWEQQSLDHLDGAFAFVVWDSRQRRLTCVRDHQGFRPFFYFDGPRRFVFATDVEAVLAAEGVPRRPDDLAIAARFLAAHGYLRDRSLYEHVRKLPPAEILTVEAGRTQHRRHWFPERLPRLPPAPVEDLALELRGLVERAVSSQLRTDFAVGSHLSGGLDSTALASCAQEQLRKQGRELAAAYSWSPPGPPEVGDDERRLVEAGARRLGLSATHVEISDREHAEFASRDILRQPTLTLLYESAVCRMAGESGVRVLLSGWGGDEFASFSGRGVQVDLLREGRLVRFVQHLGPPWRHGGRRWRLFLHELLSHWLPEPARRVANLDVPGWVRVACGSVAGLRALLSAAEWSMMQEEWCRHHIRGGVRERRLGLWRRGHLSARMEDWAWEGARRAVEHRYPLLDRRVVEFTLRLPTLAHCGPGRNRGLFRLAMAPWLPAEALAGNTKREPARRRTQAAIAARRAASDPLAAYDHAQVQRFMELRRRHAQGRTLGAVGNAAVRRNPADQA